MLNCIIVDDEPRAHTVLKHYIDRIPYLHLIASCANVMECIQCLEHNRADILFLDINMPELDGFSLLEMVNTNAAVIITTAYTDYAFKSYDYDVTDYLHKPIRFERFVSSVEKARNRGKQNAPAHYDDTIEIKTDGSLRQVNVKDILFAESLGNYEKIHCTHTTYLSLITARELQQKLPSDTFARIHKSYIINLSKITTLEKEHLYIGAHKIPVGKTYKIYLEELLRKSLFWRLY